MHPDLAFALELADLADSISLPRFRAHDLVVDTKADLTPVTDADRAVEEALREMIAAERPQDGVVGEELGEGGSARDRWILDPIDGTKNFARGIPIYATLIALERDFELSVGVVSAPALGRRWWAARGEGAYGNGTRMWVSAVDQLEDAVVSFTSDALRSEVGLELARRAWHARTFSDFWGHTLVAEGSVDVALEPVANLWDMAAVKVIVEEAGGRFTDFRGTSRPDGGSGVSSNGLLHDLVMGTLSRPTPGADR